MKLVPNAVTRAAAMSVLRAKGSSPSLLFGVGMVGMVGSTVLACRATLKLEDELEGIQSDLETLKVSRAQSPASSGPDHQKATAVLYLAGVGRVARLYGPAAVVGIGSAVCLTKSHHILKNRNLGLAAAYAAVDHGFQRYRDNVIVEYGEDTDRRMRFETEECVLLDKDGHPYATRRVNIDHEPSMYAQLFDQLCPTWAPEPEYNLAWLRNKQDWFNELLTMKGYVFLNEVYEELGLQLTDAGEVVGWLLGNGDGYIDFGIFNESQKAIDFVNGRESAILLDFNVDGSILDLIDQIDHSKKRGFTPWQR